MMKTNLCKFVFFTFLALCVFAINVESASPTSVSITHPFRNVASWLKSNCQSFEKRKLSDVDSIKRALLMLDKSQLVTKGMDGVAFKISSKIGGTSAVRNNISNELKRVQKGSSFNFKKQIPNKDKIDQPRNVPSLDLAKLVHKAKTTQDAIRAVELIELANDALGLFQESSLKSSMMLGPSWQASLEKSDVETIDSPVFMRIKVSDIDNSFLRDKNENSMFSDAEDEECVDFVALLLKDNKRSSSGGTTIVISDTVQDNTLAEILMLSPTRVHVPSYPNPTDENTKACAVKLSRSAYHVASKLYHTLLKTNLFKVQDSLSIHFVGHSFSGSVAALISAMLQGSVPPLSNSQQQINSQTKMDKKEVSQEYITNEIDHRNNSSSASSVLPLFANCSCLLIGPCPCVDKTVKLSSRTTSFVLGDDLFARFESSAIKRLEARLSKFLPKERRSLIGNGNREATEGIDGERKEAQDDDNEEGLKSFRFGTGLSKALMEDAFGNTIRNAKKRKGTDDQLQHSSSHSELIGDDIDDATSNDVGSLVCPGTVYICKPRSNGDVIISTTKRGGISEAVFWQMNDIVVSKSMLAHHHLDAYLRAFDRS